MSAWKNSIEQNRGGGEEKHITGVPSLKRCFYGECFEFRFRIPSPPPPSMIVLEICLLCGLISTFTDKMVRFSLHLCPHTKARAAQDPDQEWGGEKLYTCILQSPTSGRIFFKLFLSPYMLISILRIPIYLFIYNYIYIYIYMYTHIYMYVCVYIYTHMYTPVWDHEELFMHYLQRRL